METGFSWAGGGPRCPRCRASSLLALALVGLVSGCGGKAVVDGTSAEGGGGASATTTSTTGTTASGTSTTSTTWTGGGHPDLQLAIASIEVGIGCMPVVPADPLYAVFELTYDNSTGTAPIDAALLHPTVILGDDPDELRWTFEVTPPSSGLVPAGAIVTVRHEKVPDSGSGNVPLGPCDYCGDSGATFQVNVDVGGTWVMIGRGVGPVMCAL